MPTIASYIIHAQLGHMAFIFHRMHLLLLQIAFPKLFLEVAKSITFCKSMNDNVFDYKHTFTQGFP